MKNSPHMFASMLIGISIVLFLLNPRPSANFFVWRTKQSSAATKLSTNNNRSEITNLRNSLVFAQLEILRLKEQIQSLTHFREHFSREQVPIAIPASILARRDVSDNRYSFKIDKGRLDNVDLGDVVVFNNNLLGKVWDVSANHSVVLKVTDPEMHIPITIMSLKTPGKTFGDGISVGNGREESQCTIGQKNICHGQEYCKAKFLERKKVFLLQV